MKLKLLTKVLTLLYTANLQNWVKMCSIHFPHVPSPLLSGRSSLSEPHSCIFLGSILAPSLA